MLLRVGLTEGVEWVLLLGCISRLFGRQWESGDQRSDDAELDVLFRANSSNLTFG